MPSPTPQPWSSPSPLTPEDVKEKSTLGWGALGIEAQPTQNLCGFLCGVWGICLVSLRVSVVSCVYLCDIFVGVFLGICGVGVVLVCPFIVSVRHMC